MYEIKKRSIYLQQEKNRLMVIRMDLSLVKASAPYPTLQVTGKNERYAALLSQDFASSRGEMTAIYQYMYQNWLTINYDDELAQLLMNIAEVEMMHLDILGKMIVLLGGNPKCQAVQQNQWIFWSGNMVNYNREKKKMLLYNIALEQYAVDTYTTHAKIIQDPYVSALLLRIVEDEKLHVHLFRDYLNK